MLNPDRVRACAAYVLEKARYTIEHFQPRPPGSVGEAELQRWVLDELNACTDDAYTQPFLVAPKAFMGQQRVAGIFILAAVAAYWVNAWLALAFSALAVTVLIFELVLYKQFIDPFFRKRESSNVCGRIAPSGLTRRRIILNGHPDAAYEWRFLYRFPKILPLFVVSSLLGLLLVFVIDLCFAFFGGWQDGYQGLWLYLGILQAVLAPTAFIGILWTDFRHVSPGANDNLTGTFIVTGIARQMHEAGLRLENTEVLFLVTGSEEAGLRGSKAWCNVHAEEMEDVETIFLALDTFRDLDHLVIYNRDLNGTVAHDPRVCKLLKDAGAACGRDLPYGTVFLGSSDGTAATQAGIAACAFAAMDPAPADWYHNRRDHWSNMDEECVRVTVEVVCQAMRQFDAEGLPGSES
jgi:hypothetical protein